MPTFTTRPEIRGTFGIVASTHWIASAVGMSVLEKGGNAFDAAAAAGFTLQVVEPSTNGPLGEAPMLVWSEANRRCDMICGQGVAPAAATIARFRDLGLDLIPGTGLLAAAVPAAFDAWMRLLHDYGTMPLGEILAPAIGYAENGYPMAGRITETIAVMAEMFRREWPSSAAVYLPHGARRNRGGCSATRRSPQPTAASLPKPAAGRANARSRAPALPGIAALSPRPSSASAGTKRRSTPPGGGMAGC
jgi:gamma-glutamyltranspeptidase/glutathione hydrolase